MIDGVPHWSERGADSFSPFSLGNQISLTLNISGYYFYGGQTNYNTSVSTSLSYSKLNNRTYIFQGSVSEGKSLPNSTMTSWVSASISNVQSDGKNNYTFVLTITGNPYFSGSTETLTNSVNVSVNYTNGNYVITNGTASVTKKILDSGTYSYIQATVSNVQKII